MKRLSFSLLTITVLSFILVQSCSTDEEETITPTVQTLEPEEQVKQYTLTVTSAEGGTVSSEGWTFEEGTEITFTATPSEGYRFIGWEGNDSTNESLTITLNADQTLRALFELIPPVQYTLTVTSAEGGTVSSEGGTYDEGTEITITATPSEGYRFDGWEGYESDESTIIINISSDTEIIPIFTDSMITPTDYGIDEYWGKIVEFEPEIFFSRDIPVFNRVGLKETVKLITDYFGLYGPIEIWSVGMNASSSDKRELEKIFCERRSSRKDHWSRFTNYETCVSLNEFEEIGGAIMGQRSYGYHIMYHRYDFTFSNNSEFRHSAITGMIHEYTHIVQAANLFTKEEEDRPDGDRRRIGWGPIFFSEGTADYYQEYIQRKLRSIGISVENSPDVDGQGSNLRDKMRTIMIDDIQPNLSLCPNFNIWEVNYSTRETCSPYRFGAWGVAYLLDKVNDQDAFWKTLWPNIDEMGWDGAFEYTFGITMEQFNQEFLELLDLPIEEQLEIIPDI